jgi:glycosyltransferase involved in cell wall biosynthesis
LAIHPDERDDLDALFTHGWRLIDPLAVARDPVSYRNFVQGSAVELGVAKSGYVASSCGWFSDRSACYLASGRPVVAQDTGWTDHLPSGEGLLAFTDVEEAARAIDEVLNDYERHSRAARVLAGDLFDARAVLTRLIDVAGTSA